jgi:hypothetical protein
MSNDETVQGAAEQTGGGRAGDRSGVLSLPAAGNHGTSSYRVQPYLRLVLHLASVASFLREP